MNVRLTIRVLTAVLTVLILLAFYILFARSAAGDDDFFPVFAVIVVIIAVVAVINIIRPLTERTKDDAVAMKECASCGSFMGTAEHTCPRCGAMQTAHSKGKKQ